MTLRTSVLPLALAAAFLPACTTEPSAPAEPRAVDIRLPAEVTTIEDRVPVRATLDTVLRGHRLDADLVPRVVAAAERAFNPRSLRAGQPYRLILTLDGVFRAFEYSIDRKRYLRVADPASGSSGSTGSTGDLSAEILDFPTVTTRVAVAGEIDASRNSLVAAVDGAGEEIELALLLADVFGGQVDFNSDLQPGDRFEVLVDKDFHEREFIGYGDIVAATLVNDQRRLQAFRFIQPDGQTAYFDETGRSVRRFFLPSPLPFDPRVTSRFSRRRMHPVDGVPRAHLGVDYAAAVGTPVLAVADGVVVSAAFSGASGRMIRLRHANGYETYYLHLSAFSRGVRPGARVSQGEMIGRVGASGRVTGPHLDYRVARHGVFVDPLLERKNQTGGEPVPEESLAAFEATRDEALLELADTLKTPPVLAASDEVSNLTRSQP